MALVAQTSARPAPLESRKRRRSLWGLCLAIAASLLVAFGLGVQYQSAGQKLQADNSAPQSDEAGPVQLAQTDWADAQDGDFQDSDAQDEETIALTLADDDDTEREIQLPVTHATEDDQAWAQDESALPAGLLRSLQQAGLEVNRQQRYLPIDLSDGRRLIVPIEEIEIHDPQLVYQ